MPARTVWCLCLILWTLAGVRPAAADDLTWKLWHQLCSESGNLIYSPMSVQQALGVVALGARGQTARDMAMIPPIHEQAAAAASMTRQLDAAGERLAVANGIWAQRQNELVPAFVEAVRSVGAEIAALDFRNNMEGARKTINAWVSKHTDGHIPELVPSGALNPRTDLFIANAVYFKGSWQTNFAASRTRPQTFTRPDGTTVQTPMMHLSAVDNVQYGESGPVQLVSLPYRDEHLCMVVALPRTKDDLPAVEGSLDETQFNTWVHAMHRTDMQDVAIPRFDMRWSKELTPALVACGLGVLFDRRADLTGIDGHPRIVSTVIHQATITVDETGTVATAATGVGMVRAMARPSTPKPIFIADHPFVFCIRDVDSGTILFMGRVADPTK